MKYYLGKDGFIWWIGIVEDTEDPLQLGRCRVRCFGYHPKRKKIFPIPGIPPIEEQDVPQEHLPWATCLSPVNLQNFHGRPNAGDWVIGFFLDSTEAQEPVIMGILPAIPEVPADYFSTHPRFVKTFSKIKNDETSNRSQLINTLHNVVDKDTKQLITLPAEGKYLTDDELAEVRKTLSTSLSKSQKSFAFYHSNGSLLEIDEKTNFLDGEIKKITLKLNTGSNLEIKKEFVDDKIGDFTDQIAINHNNGSNIKIISEQKAGKIDSYLYVNEKGGSSISMATTPLEYSTLFIRERRGSSLNMTSTVTNSTTLSLTEAGGPNLSMSTNLAKSFLSLSHPKGASLQMPDSGSATLSSSIKDVVITANKFVNIDATVDINATAKVNANIGALKEINLTAPTINLISGITNNSNTIITERLSANTVDTNYLFVENLVVDTVVANTVISNTVTAQTLYGDLNWSYITSKPDPIVTVTLTGDITGTGSATLTDLTNGTITLDTSFGPGAVQLGTDTTGDYIATIAAGTSGAQSGTSGLTITAVAGESTAATIAHADTSTLTGQQGTAGIANFTIDGLGHITAVTTATYLTAEADTLSSVTGRGNSTSSSISVGGLSVSGNASISGTLSATTKSFVIDHPTKPGMILRYGSLEGPELGVYIRGRNRTGIVVLPDYWSGLVDADTITVQLTSVGKHQNLFVQNITEDAIYIGTDDGDRPIDCFYTIYAERKDVDKLIVEYVK